MKKVLMMALTVLISVAFVTVVFAQAPAGTTEKKTTTTTTTAPPEKKATTTTTTTTATPEKKETTTTTETTKNKGKRHQYTGEVTNMDMTAKMMTVKGKKGDMTFDVSSAKMKGEAKAGDKVIVKYREKDGQMVAHSVEMKGGTKTTKTTTTKTKEKKEETTAPAAPAK